VLLSACVAMAAMAMGWLGWMIWDHSTPDVQSKLISFTVVDQHRTEATVEVSLGSEDVVASCTLRAFAEDHATVGELAFVPTGSGRIEQTIRTEREATAVELVGCTTADQRRAR